MATRDSAPVGAPSWIELSTSDPARSQEFYGPLFGWTFVEGGPEYGGYVSAFVDGQLVAGLMPNQPGSGSPDGWTTYFATDDSAATQALVEANGGTTVVEPMRVMEMGTMSIFTDTAGATLGTWEPGTHPGYLVHSRLGAPAWHELHTRDLDGAVGFYPAVLGWGTTVTADSPEFRYVVGTLDETEVAGLFDATRDLAEGAPSSWVVYFGAGDTDATVARAVELGATVLDQPEDTPFGRLATVTDPTGAYLKLIGTPE